MLPSGWISFLIAYDSILLAPEWHDFDIIKRSGTKVE
jgi:hypothetical protein